MCFTYKSKDGQLINGLFFKSWRTNDIKILNKFGIGILKEYCIEIFKKKIIGSLINELKEIYEIKLEDDEAKHLLAIIRKYQNNNKKISYKVSFVIFIFIYKFNLFIKLFIFN